jgi:hypothetical protein
MQLQPEVDSMSRESSMVLLKRDIQIRFNNRKSLGSAGTHCSQAAGASTDGPLFCFPRAIAFSVPGRSKFRCVPQSRPWRVPQLLARASTARRPPRVVCHPAFRPIPATPTRRPKSLQQVDMSFQATNRVGYVAKQSCRFEPCRMRIAQYNLL